VECGFLTQRGSIIPRTLEFALPLEPFPYDPAQARRLLAEADYPNGIDAGAAILHHGRGRGE
jgi:ABC-type transport system substrate-binding protein